MGMSTSGFHKIAELVRDHVAMPGSCLQLGRLGIAFDYHTLLEIAEAHRFLECARTDIRLPVGHPLARVVDAGQLIASDVKPQDKQRVSDMAAFAALGFDSIDSVDFTADEGATLIYDLNVLGLEAFTKKRFDFILDSGTMEHVFHAPNLLANVLGVLKPGGVIAHINPMNNCTDHGFYQFSPAFYTDYYTANNFHILQATVFAVDFLADEPVLVPCSVKDTRELQFYFAARKTGASTVGNMPSPLAGRP